MEIPTADVFSNDLFDPTILFSGNKSDPPTALEFNSTTTKLPKKSGTEISFQPDDSDWNISKVNQLKNFYQSSFGSTLPISNYGQGGIHNKWGLDHRNSIDVPYEVGKQLEPYLRENNIPFLAYNKAVPSQATGKHYHIGFPSKKTTSKFLVNSTLDQYQIPTADSSDEIPTADAFDSQIKNLQTTQVTQDEIPDAASFDAGVFGEINLPPAPDTRSIEEKMAEGAANISNPLPKVRLENPQRLVGSPVSTIYTSPNLKSPDINTATDAWLNSIDSSYGTLNEEYRKQTGNNLVRFDLSHGGRMIVPLKNNQYRVQGQFTQEAVDLINAYVKGRNSGGPEEGAKSVWLKASEIDRQNQIVADDINKQFKELDEAKTKSFAENHPYLAGVLQSTPMGPALGLILDKEAAKAGIAEVISQDAQLLHNLKMLPQALYTLERYGGDSDEYEKLIEKDRDQQRSIFGSQERIYQPQDIVGKSVKGTTSGIVSLPKYALAGEFGGAYSLPLLVYIENLHRGNIEATKAALPMAIMAGSSHGLGEFLSKGTKINYNTIDDLGNPANRTIEIGKGLGNRSPFSQIRNIEKPSEWTKSLNSIDPNARSFTIESPSVSIGHLSNLERQLLIRGSNALFMGGTSAIEGANLKDVASNFVVGLTFPVGKFRVGRFDEGNLIEHPVNDLENPAQVQLLNQSRVNIPLNKATLIENQTPQYGFERGFQAKTDPTTLRLSLDQAALNLLDLRRDYKNQTYGGKDVPLKERIDRGIALQRAIGVLERQIPVETMKFFEENEALMRAAIRTNFEAQDRKAEFLKLRNEKLDISQDQNSSTIKPNDNVSLEQSPLERLRNNLTILNQGTTKDSPALVNQVAENTFGDTGKQNKWITPDRALFAYDRVLNFKGRDERRSGLTLDDMKESAKGLMDLTQIAAFHLEDFYHRGIEPTVSELANRFRITFGDLVTGLSNNDFQILFEKGKNYLDSNEADPFFSKMKQDAVERLPNRLSAEEALNFFSKHENEFEWTSGLKDFLDGKIERGERVYKQEIVDLISSGQVRVEVSIASDEAYDKAQIRIKEIHKELRQIDNLAGIDNLLIEDQNIKYNSLRDELERLKLVQHSEYSPRWYNGELLELPSGKNTTEVKLITPLKEGTYQSPHWEEKNVVAHYNTTDRTTVDNIPIYFSEEFQSDWNHDIREQGVKPPANLSLENYEAKGFEAKLINPEAGSNYSFWAFGKKGEVDAKQFDDSLPNSKFITKEDAVREFISNLTRDKDLVERNPFMQHSWKELVFKRFLRDAVVAKDENGNNKYEGIGWTTARQQKERYGKILEGKDFEWHKNDNETYSFTINDQGYLINPHELQNISLERFVELTNKEAAEKVKEQEKNYVPQNVAYQQQPETLPNGIFSLNESVELRSGIGKYSDYDVAMVNYAKKIGKRFGAKYNEKEIETREANISFSDFLEEKGIPIEEMAANKYEELSKEYESYEKRIPEKIHFLEITPSMRESLIREGFPLYGTGKSEALKYPEIGVRNRIVTSDPYNKMRESLIEKLSKSDDETVKQSNGTVFNSGLNPDAFIDMVKLMSRGASDLGEFTYNLIQRFGEQIRPFVQDLYYQFKGLASEFNSKLDIAINDWQDNLRKTSESKEWQLRQSEQGFLNLGKKSPELEAYFKDPEKHQKPLLLDFRAWMRGIALAQLSTKFSEGVYEPLRLAQRVVNNYESNIIAQIRTAKKVLTTKGLDEKVIQAIYNGNENKVTYSVNDLTSQGLGPRQIKAYQNIRAAVDNMLNLRLESKLYSIKTKADKLNATFQDLIAQGKIAGDPEYDRVGNALLDLQVLKTKTINHFQELKDTGYISLQRKGKVAAYLDDPNFPVGDPRRKIYNQFDSKNEADRWLQEQKKALGIAKNVNHGSIYDIQNVREIALREKLTPSQFEDLVDRSNANSSSPEIEKIRAEVYSRYPSNTYQLEREFIRGYDKTWQSMIDSVVHQAELYGSSFYSQIGGEEALKGLEKSGLQKSDPNLYRIAMKYIKDETSPAEQNIFSKAAIAARKFVYFWQLGYDINQLYLNAVAQPITQTYGYFSRVEYNGIKLKGLEPEQYFGRAGKLVTDVLRGKADPQFQSLVDQLASEHVLSPEFTKSLIASEGGPSEKLSSKTKRFFSKDSQLHWSSVFMTAGEKVTRTHAAAEAFLIGKEKFNLTGDDLVKFMVRAVDATQSNPTRGENPYAIRSLGEGGKLVYQFMAFNWMWWENLALGASAEKNSEQRKFLTTKNLGRRIAFTTRELAPLAIMGGIRGLPLSGFAFTLYTILTGEDPKKKFDKLLGKDSLIEDLALYGFSASQALSNKLTPSTPILDNFGENVYGNRDLLDNVPIYATGKQIFNGFKDLTTSGDRYKRLQGAANLIPRAARGPVRAVVQSQYGARTASGDIIIPRNKLTPMNYIGQALNVPPSKITEYYEEQRTKTIRKATRKFKPLRKIQNNLKQVL